MSASSEGIRGDKSRENAGKKTPANYVCVARAGTAVYVRVTGVGNMATAPALFDFAERQRAEGYRKFVFDLAECKGLDSSFMGTIVGIAAGLKRESAGGEKAPPAPANGISAGETAGGAATEEKPPQDFSASASQAAATDGKPAAEEKGAAQSDGADEQEGFVALVNVSPECLEMLQILGVDKFVRIGGRMDISGIEMARLPDNTLSREERVRLIMKAHESLVEIDKRNEAQFGAFLRRLASELGKR